MDPPPSYQEMVNTINPTEATAPLLPQNNILSVSEKRHKVRAIMFGIVVIQTLVIVLIIAPFQYTTILGNVLVENTIYAIQEMIPSGNYTFR